MARCRCSTLCSCSIVAGANTTVTGNGSLGSPYVISSTGGDGTGYVRTTASHTTAFLPDGNQEIGLLALAPGWRGYKLQVTAACRVRLYVTETHRTADLARAIGTDPPENSGLMLEYVAAAAGTYILSPLVDGYVEVGSDAAFTIDNLAGVATIISVTLTYVRTE